MNQWWSVLSVLADEAPAAEAQGPAGGLLQMVFPLLIVGFLFFFLIIKPQQRERAQREKLLSELKKNDRVVTIGGIIGHVVSVSTDEIVLKVDDNTRVRFRRSAIQSVLADGVSAESTAKSAS